MASGIEFTTNILLLGGIMIAVFVLNWQLAGHGHRHSHHALDHSMVTKRIGAAFRQVQRNLGTMNAVMEENIARIRIVKALAREADTRWPIALRGECRLSQSGGDGRYYHGGARPHVYNHDGWLRLP
ncbi:MAG: hypothetical protein R2932_34940 [Caldilineaceae bacterium]